MVIGLDNNFVCADAVHLVEHALGLAVQITFYAKRGEFVRHYADGPPGRITLRRRTAVLIGPVCLDFRRSLTFISITEGAKASSHLYGVASKVCRALGSVGGDNHPAANNGVFSEFGQFSRLPPAPAIRVSLFYDESAAF